MTNREWERKTAVIEYKHHLEEKIKDGIGKLLVAAFIAHWIEAVTR